MWSTIIAGLILAAVPALAFVAYRHPDAYRNLFLLLLCCFSFPVTRFVFGVISLWIDIDILHDYVAAAEGDTVPVLVSRLNSLNSTAHDLAITVGICVAVFLYLGFLRLLPLLGICPESSQPSDDDEADDTSTPPEAPTPPDPEPQTERKD